MSRKRWILAVAGFALLGLASDARADDRGRGGQVVVATYGCDGYEGIGRGIVFEGSFPVGGRFGLRVSNLTPVAPGAGAAQVCPRLAADITGLLERRGCTVGAGTDFGSSDNVDLQLQAVCRGTRSRLLKTIDAALTRVLTAP